MQVRVARSGGQFESRRSRLAIWGGCVTHDAPHSNSAPRTVQRSAFGLQSFIPSTQRFALLGGIGQLGPSRLRRRSTRDATIIGMTGELVAQAVALLEQFPLRSADALHVACASAWPTDLFVSADDRQCSAAKAHGLRYPGLDPGLLGMSLESSCDFLRQGGRV